jgi:hypothetical protein
MSNIEKRCSGKGQKGRPVKEITVSLGFRFKATQEVWHLLLELATIGNRQRMEREAK